MARKQKQRAKQKAVKNGKKPVGRPRKSAVAATSPTHDAAPAPKTAATEQKKPTMTGGISKKTTRRMPARSGKKDPWSEEQLTTSKKSHIIDVDLVKLFANPNSWTCLEEDEKRELLSLLPAHVHPNPGPDPENPDHKIDPLPQSFLRYSNNWRDAVRGFQFDLENGRYDPEWQAQAAVAMEERASGNFDSFKENQYEEFWGQKQKLSYDVETGDSNQVKLETLVRHGVVKAGDVWKYSRIYVKDGGRLLLEKELKILNVDKNNALTFAIPGGHRYCLKNDYPITESSRGASTPSRDDKASPPNESNSELKNEAEVESKLDTGTPANTVNGGSAKTETGAEGSVDAKLDLALSSPMPAELSNTPIVDGDLASKEDISMPNAPSAHEDTVQQEPVADNNVTEKAVLQETVTGNIVTENPVPDETIVENNTPGDIASNDAAFEDSAPDSSNNDSPIGNNATEPDADVILPGVLQPNKLNIKILKIDGRITKPSHGNAWKDFRCIRNNQDMGSLWEVRQLWAMKDK